MHTLQRYLFIVAGCALASSHAMAWGPQGHRMVAAIAFQRLSPAAQAQAQSILSDENFVGIASWADDVRLAHPETKDWHFVDIPVTAAAYDENRDCQLMETGDCAVKEIARAVAVLKDHSQPAIARHEALKFLSHFVGDIHQPLHSATNGTRTAGDRGGNSVNTLLLTKTLKLHAVWDHGLIDLDDRDEGGYVQGLVDDLVKTGKATATGSVTDWVNEAHGVAVKVGYAYPGFHAGTIPTAKVRLTQVYVNKARPASDLQLARGGVRLARLIEQALQ